MASERCSTTLAAHASSGDGTSSGSWGLLVKVLERAFFSDGFRSVGGTQEFGWLSCVSESWIDLRRIRLSEPLLAYFFAAEPSILHTARTEQTAGFRP